MPTSMVPPYDRTVPHNDPRSALVSTISRTTTTTVSTTTTTTTTTKPTNETNKTKNIYNNISTGGSGHNSHGHSHGDHSSGSKRSTSTIAAIRNNIGLVFFVHGTKSGLGTLQVNKLMQQYRVIVHQRDYRFEVYGQPQDIAAAVVEGFFWQERHQHHQPQQNHLHRQYRRDGHDDDISLDHLKPPKETNSRPDQSHASTTNEGELLLGSFYNHNRAMDDDDDGNMNAVGGIDAGTSGASGGDGLKEVVDSEEGNIVSGDAMGQKKKANHGAVIDPPNVRADPLPIAQRKTDYDLYLSQRHLTKYNTDVNSRQQQQIQQPMAKSTRHGATASGSDHKKNVSNGEAAIGGETMDGETVEPLVEDPYSIVLSMPPRLIQYLVCETGGLWCYLVEEVSLTDCFLKGYTMDELQTVAEGAGLEMAICEDAALSPGEYPLWIRCGDLEAMRAILNGLTAAFASRPLYDSMSKFLDISSRERRSQWDKQLKAMATSLTETFERDNTVASDDQWVTMGSVYDTQTSPSSSSAPSTEATTGGGDQEEQEEFEPQATPWSFSNETDVPPPPPPLPSQQQPQQPRDLYSGLRSTDAIAVDWESVSEEGEGEDHSLWRRATTAATLTTAASYANLNQGRTLDDMFSTATAKDTFVQSWNNRQGQFFRPALRHQSGTWADRAVEDADIFEGFGYGSDHGQYHQQPYRKRVNEAKPPAESESASNFFAEDSTITTTTTISNSKKNNNNTDNARTSVTNPLLDRRGNGPVSQRWPTSRYRRDDHGTGWD